MADIKCPNCGEIFQVDESDYAQIVKQIRDKEFEEELKRREEVLNDKSQRELEIARLNQEKRQEEVLARKAAEITDKDK